MFRRIASLATAAVATLGGALPVPVLAQSWPSKPIRIIAPSSPGGPTDLATRLISARVNADLKQALVVDNRPGAGGMIGPRAAAQAAPDGYTFVMGNPGPVAVVPHTEKEVGYDIVNDFEGVSNVMAVPIVLIARADVPVSSVADLVALMKRDPKAIAFGSSGVGQSPHMAAEYFQKSIGVDFLISPYRGAPPAVNDLLGGAIQAMFDTTTGLPHVKAGKLKALAIGSARRSTLMPDLPTMAELGYPGFEITSWYVLLAPAKTPKDIIARMNKVVVDTLNQPETRHQLAAINAEATPSTPEETQAFVKAQLDNWGNIVRRIRGRSVQDK